MANIATLKSASSLYTLQEEPKLETLELSALKSLFPKGLQRGLIAEINGRRSSGRTSACLHILAQSTTRGEICAVIDLHDSFHPASAHAAGVDLSRLIWVRCRGSSQHAIRATDLLLHAGGFGLVWLDLCETPERILQRVPLSYWYRFRRAVEDTPTILLISAESPQAKSCTAVRLELKSKLFHWAGTVPFLILRGLIAGLKLRKPVNSGEHCDVRVYS